MNITSEYHELVERIQRLSDEQHQLYQLASQHEFTNAQRERLAEIKVELRTLWQERERERLRFRDTLDGLMAQRYHPAA